MRKVVVILLAVFIVCESQQCGKEQFRCDDGNCIDSALKCDGALNCSDGSDEDFVICRTRNCEKKYQFQCVYGACVDKNVTCDGVRDCADNSDELLVECRNETTYFGCLKKLIDERNFFDPIIIGINNCETKDSTCKDGENIGRNNNCDGVVHCKDGTDETLESCASTNCFLKSFRCKYGACIDSSLMCNGINNCADGSDELEQLCHTDNKGLCVLPSFPKNGYYSVADLPNAHPAQVIESVHLNYSCHSGYKLVGTQSPYCVKGWWSDDPPKCIPQCLLNKHISVEYLCLPKNSDSQASAKECDDHVEDGTTVRPQCREPNYYYSGVLVNMHCTDGVWDQVIICSPQCGLVSSEGRQLIIGGKSAQRGELPWHAGIYKKNSQPFMQICGGSLVTNTVVISAAHCFWTETEKLLPASLFAVAVGKLYRPWNNPRDKDAQKSDVREIKIPARFQGAAANFQEDIAVMILTTPFEFRTYVRPVCIDFDPKFNRRQLSVGAAGKVAGWGLAAEDGAAAPVLQVVELPYVDIEQCIAASPAGFIEYITGDKICAGTINGTVRTVCRGDSGGGLAFAARERAADRYFLRGLVSTAPTGDQLCSTHVYTTFTEISKHEEFIKQYLLVGIGSHPAVFISPVISVAAEPFKPEHSVETVKVEGAPEPLAAAAPARERVSRCVVGGAHAFILKISSLFGLAPLKFESRSDGYMVSISSAMCVYSFILITILVICTVFGLAAEISVGVELSVRMSSRMSQVVSTCDVLVVVVTAGTGVYGAPRRMRNMLSFMGSVAAIDHSIGGKYSKATERKLRALLLCILIFFSVLLVDDFCFYAMQEKRTGRQWNVVMNYIGFYLLWYVVMILELQFAFTALSVRARFQAVNDALALTARQVSIPLEKPKNSPPLNIYAIRVAPSSGTQRPANVSLLVDSITREQPVVVKKSVHGSATLAVPPCEAVRQLASLHGTLCEVVRCIDASYGLPLIAVLISTLLHLVVTPYFLIMEIIVSINRVHFLVLQFLWCLTHMLRMLVVVEPCHYTIAEGRRTQTLVCRLMNCASDRTLGTLPSRVELFSRQLLLQSVCYSPLGICTLNRSLVASVIGAVTTYLVILIQFQRCNN